MQIIYDTLKDAGITYDEGPDIGGPCGPYVQSERAAIYKKYAEELVRLGGAYYCFCDKERIESLKDENGVGRYDKHCLHLSKRKLQRSWPRAFRTSSARMCRSKARGATKTSSTGR